MSDLIHFLRLVEIPFQFININEVFLSIVDYLGSIVEMHHWPETQNHSHIHSIGWPSETSLVGVLYVHVFIIVWVPHFVEI